MHAHGPRQRYFKQYYSAISSSSNYTVHISASLINTPLRLQESCNFIQSQKLTTTLQQDGAHIHAANGNKPLTTDNERMEYAKFFAYHVFGMSVDVQRKEE